MRIAILCLIFICLSAQANSPWTLHGDYPHHPAAFTQGLSYRDGLIYETTGRYGQSSLLIYAPGELPNHIPARLPEELFGEGSVVLDDRVLWLTWKAGLALNIPLAEGQAEIAFRYNGEGWGLATDDTKQFLAKSNGSNVIEILDLEGNFVRALTVTGMARHWSNLNELEWVDNTIFAFVWLRDELIAIDATTGKLKALYNLTALRELQSEHQAVDRQDSINGLAYDPNDGRFFITGKYWDKLYKIELEGWHSE